jgi:hypothetical protein
MLAGDTNRVRSYVQAVERLKFVRSSSGELELKYPFDIGDASWFLQILAEMPPMTSASGAERTSPSRHAELAGQAAACHRVPMSARRPGHHKHISELTDSRNFSGVDN